MAYILDTIFQAELRAQREQIEVLKRINFSVAEAVDYPANIWQTLINADGYGKNCAHKAQIFLQMLNFAFIRFLLQKYQTGTNPNSQLKVQKVGLMNSSKF